MGLALAFALRFIFPCAQRCFSSRDSFLRAAALILGTGLDAWTCFAFAHRLRWAAAIVARVAAENVRRLRVACGGRPALGCPVEFRPSIAAIARSMRLRSAFSSSRIPVKFMMSPLAVDIVAGPGDLFRVQPGQEPIGIGILFISVLRTYT